MKNWLAALLIAVITLLAYANSLDNSFVWDDHYVIVSNDFIRDWKNLPLVFSKAYFGPSLSLPAADSGETRYRPVVSLTYFIGYSLWGTDPFGYHLSSLLFHIFSAVLFYFLAARLLKDKNPALLAALLFALHPVNTEAVDVISFRASLLSFLFFALAFIFFMNSEDRRGNRRWFYAGSLAAFLLALFSKESAISLPVVLAVYDYLFISGASFKAVLRRFHTRYLGYFIVAAFYIWVRFFVVINPADFTAVYPGGNFFMNASVMLRVFVYYIRLLVFPVNAHLIMHGDRFFGRSLFDPLVLLALCLLAGCIIAAFRMRKTSPAASFAISWFLITLLPTANIFPINNFAANRYLYLPVAGFCLLLALALSLKCLKKIAVSAALIILVSYAMFTAVRNAGWKDDIALWSEMAQVYPKSFAAHSYLGYWLLRSGSLDRAIEEFRLSTRLAPAGIKTVDYRYLGACYLKKNMFAEAREALEKALEYDPDPGLVRRELEAVYKKTGNR